jgi:hypothetical protein
VPYVDTNTIHVPATGAVAPAAWGTGVRNNLEFLVDPPTCDVFNSAGVTVTNNSDTILSANSERFDNDAMHSTVTNSSRITIQTAGRYFFRAAVQFNGSATGVRKVSFRLNGTTESIRLQQGSGTGSAFYCGAFADYVLAAGSYVEVMVLQSSGGDLTTQLHSFAALYTTR